MSFKFLNREMRKMVRFKARRRQSDCNVSQGRAKSVFKSDPTAKMMTGKENNMNIRPHVIKDVFPPLHASLSLSHLKHRSIWDSQECGASGMKFLFVCICYSERSKCVMGVNKRGIERAMFSQTHTHTKIKFANILVNLEIYSFSLIK